MDTTLHVLWTHGYSQFFGKVAFGGTVTRIESAAWPRPPRPPPRPPRPPTLGAMFASVSSVHSVAALLYLTSQVNLSRAAVDALFGGLSSPRPPTKKALRLLHRCHHASQLDEEASEVDTIARATDAARHRGEGKEAAVDVAGV